VFGLMGWCGLTNMRMSFSLSLDQFDFPPASSLRHTKQALHSLGLFDLDDFLPHL